MNRYQLLLIFGSMVVCSSFSSRRYLEEKYPLLKNILLEGRSFVYLFYTLFSVFVCLFFVVFCCCCYFFIFFIMGYFARYTARYFSLIFWSSLKFPLTKHEAFFVLFWGILRDKTASGYFRIIIWSNLKCPLTRCKAITLSKFLCSCYHNLIILPHLFIYSVLFPINIVMYELQYLKSLKFSNGDLTISLTSFHI